MSQNTVPIQGNNGNVQQMNQVTQQPKSVAGIYAFGLTFVFFALIGHSIAGGVDIIALAIIAIAVSAIVSVIRRASRKKKVVQQQVVSGQQGAVNAAAQQAVPGQAQPQQVQQTVENAADQALFAPTGDAVLDEILKIGADFVREMAEHRRKIKNISVQGNCDNIASMTRKIVSKLREKPELAGTARRFFDYHLSTTLKLVRNYSYMENQGVSGSNIDSTMQKIKEALEKLSKAFQVQLDKLFFQTAMDLESDIAAMDMMLNQEGLTDEDDTNNLSSFMKQGGESS